MTDFFISYNKADRKWAEWIAWTLEENGYTVVIQVWDFRPGGNFVLDMQRAASDSDKTIAVLSQNYLDSAFTQPEWASAFVDDPRGLERQLIPIRVSRCDLSGLLKSINYVDCVGVPENEAKQRILDTLKERAKPTQPPSFPGAEPTKIEKTAPEPSPYPGIIWNIPERNAFFTGREAILKDLHQRLTQENTAALSQAEAISGSGGIGKTQAAVEYAHRHRQDYQAIFWVRSETETELTAILEFMRDTKKDDVRTLKHATSLNGSARANCGSLRTRTSLDS